MCFANCISTYLKPINDALREFDQLYEQLHGLITIKVGDLNWVYKCVLCVVVLLVCITKQPHNTKLTGSVYNTHIRMQLHTRWRDEQEQHLRAAGKPALSEAQVRDFVDRFMPAYEAYLPRLYATSSASGGASTVSKDGAPSQANLFAARPQLALEIDEARLPLRRFSS